MTERIRQELIAGILAQLRNFDQKIRIYPWHPSRNDSS